MASNWQGFSSFIIILQVYEYINTKVLIERLKCYRRSDFISSDSVTTLVSMYLGLTAIATVMLFSDLIKPMSIADAWHQSISGQG